MVLLDALACAVPSTGLSLSAVHVHHGISPNADKWAEFCAVECARRDVPLTVRRVRVEDAATLGIEAAARAARYNVFAEIVADFVALAHHAGDQAETLLLQLLRGAGPHGLAAMPLIRPLQSRCALLRPLLALPDAAIEAYAQARELRWIDDESNADTSLKRNFLRHEIAPRLAAAFPGYPATLARAAAHQAEAAALLDELAAIDAREAHGWRCARPSAQPRGFRTTRVGCAAPREEPPALVPATAWSQSTGSGPARRHAAAACAGCRGRARMSRP